MTTGGEALDAFLAALLVDDAAELYDRAPCGYLSTTPDGTIVKVNQTFLTLVGYEREELVGRLRFAQLLSVGGRIYHETHYAPMLRMQGAAHEIALDLIRRDGTRLPVLVNSVLQSDPDGRPVVVRTAVFDATQRREYERELLRAKERAEASEARSTALARTLQQTLIPPTPPAIPGLDLAARYRPAGDGGEVGGDFYDIFQVGVGDWVVVIGDVCGKGVDAAVVTALVRYTLRAVAVEHARPAQALTLVNQVLRRHGTARFCTVAFVRLRHAGLGWEALVSSAGHPLPMLRDAAGAVREVGRPGTLLGVIDDPPQYDVPVPLNPGDALLLYTDGVPEARNGTEFYGDQRTAAVLARERGTASDLAAALLADTLAFQDGTARDDIALVVVRVPEGAATDS
ncbi:MAG: phosphoserine phosphatase RsbU/P [Pseudonocardiales bacterium]|nr:phosphoserine phosphatase RsbU/P [Pseudonocardiales bacterium]